MAANPTDKERSMQRKEADAVPPNALPSCIQGGKGLHPTGEEDLLFPSPAKEQIQMDLIRKELITDPHIYTAWFKIAFHQVEEHIESII